MAEPDAEIKDTVSGFLASHGRTVKEIPRAANQTPDLLVDENSPDATLVEIKVKTDDPSEMANLSQQLQTGEVVGRSKPTDGWNRLDALVSDAQSQMKAIDPQRTIPRLVWFHCVGLDSSVGEMRLVATIYGTPKLISMQISGVVTACCFWNSSFFRHRSELDGVVISRGEKAQLHLNEFSPRFAAFAHSHLVQVFWDRRLASGKVHRPSGDELRLSRYPQCAGAHAWVLAS